MLSVDDLSPSERIVFIASCQLEQAGSGDPRESLIHDPEYANECEHLAELGWLERVEVEHAEERELAGYRLSNAASAAHSLQSAAESVN